MGAKAIAVDTDRCASSQPTGCVEMKAGHDVALQKRSTGSTTRVVSKALATFRIISIVGLRYLSGSGLGSSQVVTGTPAAWQRIGAIRNSGCPKMISARMSN